MDKQKVLVITITTARRLSLLKTVLESIYKNSKFDIKTVIGKNGTFPNDEYYNFNFELPNIVKAESHPGGHLSKALNVCLDELTDEDWVLFIEDDFVLTDDNWLQKCIDTFNSIENCGTLGIRLHGGQRKYNPRKEYTLDCLQVRDIYTFEVFWSDGILLYKGDIIRKHNIRYDEKFIAAGEICDICHTLSDLGYENWRTELGYEHYHITGDKTGTDKWKYAEMEVDMKKCNADLYLKWKDTTNPKIKEWLLLDTVDEQEYVKRYEK